MKAEDLPNDPDELVELYEEQMDLFNTYSEECERIERKVGPFSDPETGEVVSILSKSEKELTDPEELVRDVIVSLMTEQHAIWLNLQLIQMDALIREIELPEQKTDQAESAQEGKKETGIEISEDDTAISEEDNVFRKHGDFWIVKYQGLDVGSLKASIGMEYINFLLMHQEQEFKTPLQLEAAVRGPVPASQIHNKMTSPELEENRMSSGRANWYEKIGREAVKDYKKRYKELEREIDEARENNDPATKLRLQQQMGLLITEINAEKIRYRYPQGWDEGNEKARKRISNGISRAIKAIENYSEGLASHLKKSLFPFEAPYSYRPTPPIDWIT